MISTTRGVADAVTPAAVGQDEGARQGAPRRPRRLAVDQSKLPVRSPRAPHARHPSGVSLRSRLPPRGSHSRRSFSEYE